MARVDPVVIRSRGIVYDPMCLVVSLGTTVTFEDDFATHPLVGGEIVDGRGVPDPASPIPPTSSGSSIVVTFDTPGLYGYYCVNHVTLGMAGAIRVDI